MVQPIGQDLVDVGQLLDGPGDDFVLEQRCDLLSKDCVNIGQRGIFCSTYTVVDVLGNGHTLVGGLLCRFEDIVGRSSERG